MKKNDDWLAYLGFGIIGLVLLLWIGVSYVALHFIMKFW